MKSKVDLRNKMRIIEDFPVEGVSYKDITTILQDKDAFQESIRLLADALEGIEYDFVLGVEARGFIFGAALAYAENKGFLMARKEGKLPGDLIQAEYSLEYGEAVIELDKDSVPEGARVVVLDDLLATGGTAKATCELVEEAGGQVVLSLFLTELTSLKGREVIEKAGYPVKTILKWDH